MGNHEHRHANGHVHGHVHQASVRLGPGLGRIHRVGRRRFLADLGRNTFAVALLGGFVAACSSDGDEPSGAATSPPEPNTSETTQPAPPTQPPASAATTGAPGSTAPDADANELRWAQASLGSVSAYVLVRGNEAAVVDTGSSGSADRIGEALAMLGVDYDDVRHVVLTHSHPDHIGSLPVVLQRSGSAAAYAGEADVPNIAAPSDVIAVGDGDDVFGLQVIHTPGHTPGSISLFDPGIGLLLAGDALNGNDDGSVLSGPSERFSSDITTALSSVTKLAQFEVEAVGMGHGQPVVAGAGPLLESLAAEL